MKKILLSLICLALIGQILANQSTIERIRALQALMAMRSTTVDLSKERETAVTNARNVPPKGEFEDSVSYQRRLADVDRNVERIIQDFENREEGMRQALQHRRRQIEQEIEGLLIASREIYSTRNFDFGTYDPDNQRLPIMIRDTDEVQYSQLSAVIAQYVKGNISRFQLRAERQLNRNLQWEYRNWELFSEDATYAIGERSVGTIAALPEGYRPPLLVAEPVQRIFEPSNNNVLDAEEAGYLAISVSNTGDGLAMGVELVIDGPVEQGLSWESSVFIGEISPGQTVEARINVAATDVVADASVTLNISFRELYGFYPDPVSITFGTAALQAPNLVVADYGIDSRDGMIRPNEAVTLTVRIQNVGGGRARNVTATPELGEGVRTIGNISAANLGDLGPGEFSDLNLELIANRDATAFPVAIRISELRSRYSPEPIPLNLSLQTRQRTTRDFAITGNRTQGSEISLATGLSVDIEEGIPRGVRNPNAFGVIIGIENYVNTSPVPYAERDASYMKQYFMNTLGIPEYNIISLMNQQATLSGIDQLFGEGGRLPARVRDSNPDIYFYYAGHGAPDMQTQKAYLVPNDGRLENIQRSCYPLDRLYANLESVPHNSVTVMIDACFSGSTRDDGTLFEAGRAIGLMVEATPPGQNMNVFSASQPSQISWAYPEKNHGLFSYFLMKGMKGEADSNNDRSITVGELRTYVQEEVARVAAVLEKDQVPQIDTPDPDRILIRLAE
ncbi:MAG: caspase family protein [Candidatus Cloacimonadota bacterium]